MVQWDVITFDCYGTLINWEEGIRVAFDGFAKRADAEDRGLNNFPGSVEFLVGA